MDSASTSKEILKRIFSTMNSEDTLGFPLFIILFEKVMSLSSNKDHIMNGISGILKRRTNLRETAPGNYSIAK